MSARTQGTSAARHSLAAVCLLAGLVGACVSPGAAATTVPNPTPTASDSIGPSSNSSCYSLFITGEKMLEDTATMASISPFIVVGTFKGEGKSFWSTKDGTPPPTAREAQSTLLLTAISLTVDTVVRGSPDDSNTAAIYGGSVGCTSVLYDDPLSLNVGTRYLMFGTGPAEDAAGNLTNAFPVYEAWPVGADDIVQTKLEGNVALQDEIKQIEAHPVAPPVYPPGSTGALPSDQPAPSIDSGP